MKEEDILLKKRLLELSDKAYKNSMFYFTDFLSLPEISLFHELKLPQSKYKIFGGNDNCERQIIRFGDANDLGYEIDFPIVMIKAEPLIQKFSDEFSHRDFLGAIMSLGIKREVIGDIILSENIAYFFVIEKMKDYIIEQLTKAKHTHIRCCVYEDEVKEVEKNVENHEILVSSLRIDGVIAKLFHLSRSQAITMFQEKKVYLNSRVCENNSGLLKPEDVIAIRGYGKVVFKKELYETKKGRICVLIEKYI